MNSLFLPLYRQKDFLPVVHAYYDRADMVSTTYEEVSHAHTLCEIMYVNEGGISVQIGDTGVAVGRKQYIWIDAIVPHTLILPRSNICSVMNIEFQLEELIPRGPTFGQLYRQEPVFREMIDHPVPYLVLTDTGDTIYNLIKQVISLADSTHHEAETFCTWLTTQVMLLIARQRRLACEKNSMPIQNTYVAAAAGFIAEHYLESLTVQHIAGLLHVQPTYLHRLFKEHMGKTIGEYIQKLRIAHAKALLEQTDRTLLDIAAAAGMSNQQRFVQQFRRATGMSPSEYRIQAKEKKKEQ